MCGRFSLRDPHSHPINLHLGVSIDAVQPPRFNIAPQNTIVIGLRDDRAGKRDVQLMERSAVFGFLPHWAKPDTRPQINARAETVAEKPYFRTAFAKHRCLVPADGWYEWRVIAGKKVPYFIRRPDNADAVSTRVNSPRNDDQNCIDMKYVVIGKNSLKDLFCNAPQKLVPRVMESSHQGLTSL